MRIDRRDFVRIGALGGAGILGAGPQLACMAFRRRSPQLRVEIKGLCLVERLRNAVAIHMVSSSALATPLDQHFAYLSVPTTDVDAATNAASVSDPADSARTAFMLNGNVTLDSGLSGGPDLTLVDDPVTDQIPSTDDGWKSVNLGARLSTLCGSTHITAPPSKFTAHVTLEHGHLRAIKPEGNVGPVTVWSFTRTQSGVTTQVAKQPMTNVLLYTVSMPAAQPAFTIGSQKLVLKTGATDVILKNLPDPKKKGHCMGTSPCMDHMAAYYELVDKQFVPDLVAIPKSLISPSADPNYCPPGV